LVAEYRKKNIQLVFADVQDAFKQTLVKAEIPGIIISPSVQAALSTVSQGEGGLLVSASHLDDVDDHHAINQAAST
jgi:hypothetical protein